MGPPVARLTARSPNGLELTFSPERKSCLREPPAPRARSRSSFIPHLPLHLVAAAQALPFPQTPNARALS